MCAWQEATGIEYVEMICRLYGDVYDDREEESKPGGESWAPGKKAMHLSLSAFQKQLSDIYDIKLSSSKLRKILITGGCWTTERSREVQALYEDCVTERENGGKGMKPEEAVRAVAEDLGVSIQTVCMNLPYERTVYNFPGKSRNAVRCDRAREKRKRCRLLIRG